MGGIAEQVGGMSCSVLNDDGFIAFGCGGELVVVLNRVVIFSLNQIVHTTYIYTDYLNQQQNKQQHVMFDRVCAYSVCKCACRVCMCWLSGHACRHTPRKVCVRWLQHRVAAGRARTI